MPWIRKLPSGKWNAVVRLPNGKRTSKTDPLKGLVTKWALDLEAQIRRGDTFDPSAGKITVEAWHAKWWGDAGPAYLGYHARRSYSTQWRLRVQPEWGRWRIGAIRPEDIVEWCTEMDGAGKTPRANEIAYHVLSSLLRDAAERRLIPANPCRGVSPASVDQKPPRWYDDEECARLIAAFPRRDRLMIDLALHTGLRWGELAGLRGLRVQRLRHKIAVRDVLLPDCTLRPYPKSTASVREVPVPLHLRTELYARAEEDLSAFVFRSPMGGPLQYQNWHRFVWTPAAEKAGLDGSPHCMRHTAASRLVMARVDLYRVKTLLGHSSIKTTERYAHLAPEYHEAILDAWADTQVTHGPPDVVAGDAADEAP
jgi:integrase